jgi:hypothetical protein
MQSCGGLALANSARFNLLNFSHETLELLITDGFTVPSFELDRGGVVGILWAGR